MTQVKARNTKAWEIDVLGVPYGGHDNGRDSDGQYFSERSQLHDDKFPLPPVVYYHGLDESGAVAGSPEYIGKAVNFEDRPDGRWYHVILDETKDTARRVWEAAKNGIARASSGTAGHLARFASNGHIDEWPVVELSLFDAIGDRQPANQYAVAIPRLKALGIEPQTIGEKAEDGEPSPVATGAELKEVKNTNEVIIMTEKVETQAAPAIDYNELAKALKAQEAAQQAAQQEASELETLRAKVKEFEDKPEAPIGYAAKADVAIHVADGTKHYDNVASSDLAFMVGTLEAAKQNGRSRRGASVDAVKALARRLDSEETQRNESGRMASNAFKAMNLKANEINQSTLANYGDEWVGVYYSGSLWESIRHETAILGKLPSMEVPAGAESVVIPLESTDPTWYKVAQAASLSANPGGIPTNTVTASNLGTANKTMTLAKMGARVLWTGELEEDSVLPYVNQLRMQLARSGAEYLESALIDGDTATGATTNINDIAGTPGGTEYWLTVDGFRKLALVTNTANSRDGGVLTSSDFLETVKLMGVGGSNADLTKTEFIIPYNVNWKALELADVKTRDVFANATIESGRLSNIFGYNVNISHNMHKPQVSRLANSAGKIDLDTAGNNTTSAILAVRYDQWMFGWRRRMTLETTRVPAADSTEIVALMRFGLVNRDTEASAISYNITV